MAKNLMVHRRDSDVLTTGQVAKICHVAPRTVSKWFDAGELRGYRIPGSRDRRIPRRQLVAFMRAHEMPLDGLDNGCCRVLIVDECPPDGLVEAMNASPRYEVRTAANGFEAGLLAQEFRPDFIVLNADGDPAEAAAIGQQIKACEGLAHVKVIAAGGNGAVGGNGFDARIAKPYTAAELAQQVDEMTDSYGP